MLLSRAQNNSLSRLNVNSKVRIVFIARISSGSIKQRHYFSCMCSEIIFTMLRFPFVNHTLERGRINSTAHNAISDQRVLQFSKLTVVCALFKGSYKLIEGLSFRLGIRKELITNKGDVFFRGLQYSVNFSRIGPTFILSAGSVKVNVL